MVKWAAAWVVWAEWVAWAECKPFVPYFMRLKVQFQKPRNAGFFLLNITSLNISLSFVSYNAPGLKT